MPDPNIPESHPASDSSESFSDALSQFEQSHSRKQSESGASREATVIALSADSVFLDLGLKSEGILPIAAFQNDRVLPKVGDKLLVSIKGRDPEGFYELVLGKFERPTDWSALEKAFVEKTTIVGTVTGVVKGGLSVDLGVRAFMPASRTGTRDAAEMEQLVGQDIRCRITKLEVGEEDVVVDRRVIAEEEEAAAKERKVSELREGDVVQGTVRSLTDYGAFVDLGGVDGLLHVGEISWSRVNRPSDVLSVGQTIDVKVIKIDWQKHRISLSLKQLVAHPWESVSGRYKVGDRVGGTVTRLADFGAFVELEAGIEGLIHISEMSWARRVRTAGDVVKPGDNVESVILAINPGERRISLGLKQALGDPWADISTKVKVGSVVEGPVTNITKFGAFVRISEGVEGMVHISEMSAEKRINHPQEVVKVGQMVKAQVLAVDPEKRMIRLSMKQLVPNGLDEYLAEHRPGDTVTGRIVEVTDRTLRVELGEGILATCKLSATSASSLPSPSAQGAGSKPNLSALGSMLQARWKSGPMADEAKAESVRAGQIRRFRIAKLDTVGKTVELELSE